MNRLERLETESRRNVSDSEEEVEELNKRKLKQWEKQRNTQEKQELKQKAKEAKIAAKEAKAALKAAKKEEKRKEKEEKQANKRMRTEEEEKQPAEDEMLVSNDEEEEEEVEDTTPLRDFKMDEFLNTIEECLNNEAITLKEARDKVKGTVKGTKAERVFKKLKQEFFCGRRGGRGCGPMGFLRMFMQGNFGEEEGSPGRHHGPRWGRGGPHRVHPHHHPGFGRGRGHFGGPGMGGPGMGGPHTGLGGLLGHAQGFLRNNP